MTVTRKMFANVVAVVSKIKTNVTWEKVKKKIFQNVIVTTGAKILIAAHTTKEKIFTDAKIQEKTIIIIGNN